MTSWRLRPAGLGLCRPTRHLWDTEDRFARFKRRFKRRSSFPLCLTLTLAYAALAAAFVQRFEPVDP